MKPRLCTLGWLVSLAVCTEAFAQITYEKSDGVTFQVTRTPKSIPVTEMRTEQHKTYVPQTTTQYQSYQQTYVAPVTQYQWVARQRNWWNPLAQPYWTTQLEPVTSWQAHQGTVQVPTTRTDWVENNVTRQVPVTTYQTVMAETRDPVGIAAPSGGPAIASRPESYGGTQMTSDPPRSGGTDYRR